MKEPVVIVPYRPAWRGEFVIVGRKIRQALGEEAIRIDHIGSTAVAGLDAKPVIDIQVSISSFEAFEPIRQGLTAIGFVYRAGNPDRTKRYFREQPGMRRTHIHVRENGSFSEQLALLFRDYMREHAEEARAYAELKYRLSELHKDERERYVEAKEPYIWDALRKASRWSQTVGWRPGHSDL